MFFLDQVETISSAGAISVGWSFPHFMVAMRTSSQAMSLESVLGARRLRLIVNVSNGAKDMSWTYMMPSRGKSEES